MPRNQTAARTPATRPSAQPDAKPKRTTPVGEAPARKTATDVAAAESSLKEQRRSYRVQISRAHILDVAETLFGDRGYGATSFEHVAAGSEFSVAAVYKLFAGKQDLLNAVLARRFDEMRQDIAEITGSGQSGLDELLALCAYYLDYFQRHPSFGRLTLRVYPAGLESVPDFAQYSGDVKEGTEILARALRRGQSEKTVKTLDASWLATLVQGMVMFHHSMDNDDAIAARPPGDLLAVIRDAVALPPTTTRSSGSVRSR